MEEKVTVSKVALRYGILTSLVVVVFSLILQFTDQADNRLLGSIAYIFIITGIVMGIKYFKQQNSFISYGQGLGLGTLLSTVVGFISGLFMYVYIKFIDDSMIQKIKDKAIEEYEKAGMSEDQIEKAMDVAGNFMGPGAIFIMSILSYALIGFILSLIIAAIMKKENEELTV
jgi:hypothetical protein